MGHKPVACTSLHSGGGAGRESRAGSPQLEARLGLHPLLVFLAQAGEAVGGKLWPVNAGTNTAQDHVELP